MIIVDLCEHFIAVQDSQLLRTHILWKYIESLGKVANVMKSYVVLRFVPANPAQASPYALKIVVKSLCCPAFFVPQTQLKHHRAVYAFCTY